MLKSLKLTNVGPAPKLELNLADRLNLLTGDNGLGKSFLLDVVWWVLTRKWPHDLNDNLTSGYPARPADPKSKASIAFDLTTAKATSVSYESTYSNHDQAWVGRPGRPWNPGLVVYAHADGGFSVWDPARNYWKKKGGMDIQESLPGYVFSPKNVWDGLDAEIGGKTTRVCNGLLADWAAWIRERGDTAARMEKVLARLAPTGEAFEVGPLVRLSVNDARDIPSIHMPYADAVPILHAASGVRRVVGLAYMLLWSWNEHVRASELLAQQPTTTVVLLFDELESHLHPRWQRTILRSMLHIAEELHSKAEIQLIAATHSPLILASAEPVFDANRDAWFDIDLERKKVVLRSRQFVSRGEVSNWLTSDAFDLSQARSKEAEDAIEQALAVLRDPNPTRRAVEDADAGLRNACLPDIDPFWVRWGHYVETKLPKKNQSANQAPAPARKKKGPSK
ncbi:MAG: ATP-binding protein [Prosthecobacter sp.]|uniref:AAA family ATPase n=1 Tax=Prosthecobacter sp. TaxID=1965333 RepID=UPI0026097632|nr:ATP-binding protein [Prosthecobacter sp.]MCF7790312.1 ATP-binding protein [Prosthecobacter sp.]